MDERTPYVIEFPWLPEITATDWDAYERWLARQARDVLTMPPEPSALPAPAVPWKPSPDVIDRCEQAATTPARLCH